MNAQQIRCKAENDALDQPSVAARTLSVLFPPRRILVRQFETDRRQMIAGETTRLSCVVPSANPAPEITWEFKSGDGNQPVVKHGGYLLNRTASEYGGYEVENRGRTNFPLKCGKNALDAFANPPVWSHLWHKDGVFFDTIHVRGPEISGKSVMPQDSGLYTLAVTYRFGSANVSVRLTVEYSARVTYVTSPVTAGFGEDVALECKADGVPLKQGMASVLKSVQEDKRAVLRLNASHDTAGAYTCRVDNGVGQPNYTTAYLLLERAPVLVRNPGYDRAVGPVGGRATLRCRVIAVPTARVLWTLESASGGRGDSVLYNTSKYQFHQVQLNHSAIESTLYVVGLEERDFSRRVRCRVRNRLGDDHAYISIGPPTAPDIPSYVEALSVQNTSAMLRWQPGFDGGSDQFFEVQYGNSSGVKSLNSSSSQVMLTGLEPAELYRVQVRSINMHGRTSTFTAPMEFVTLTKDGSPPPPRSMTSTDEVLPTTIIIASAALIVLVFLGCLLAGSAYVPLSPLLQRHKSTYKPIPHPETPVNMSQKNSPPSPPSVLIPTPV